VRIAEAGRFVHAAGARTPRRYLETNLLSVHGRAKRLRAIAGAPRAQSQERDVDGLEAVRVASTLDVARNAEWLLLRDYDGSGRERNVIFLFRDDTPRAIVKVRARDGAGPSLRLEADALRAIAPLLDARLRGTVPRVEEYAANGAHELLVLSALPGRSLSILMQRSLRPRSTHVAHLLAAAKWLGAFHRVTRTAVHGDFWPSNILFRSPNEVSGVVDWEHARVNGSRWNDVFLLPLLFATDAPSWRAFDPAREFVRAFCTPFRGRNAIADGIEAYFRTYAREAGVDRGILDVELANFLRARDARLFDLYTRESE